MDWYNTSCVLDVKLVLQPAAKVVENNTKSWAQNTNGQSNINAHGTVMPGLLCTSYETCPPVVNKRAPGRDGHQSWQHSIRYFISIDRLCSISCLEWQNSTNLVLKCKLQNEWAGEINLCPRGNDDGDHSSRSSSKDHVDSNDWWNTIVGKPGLTLISQVIANYSSRQWKI